MSPLVSPLVWLLAALPAALLVGTPAHADEFRPALLEIEEAASGRYTVLWKAPLRRGRPTPLVPILPDGLEAHGPPSVRTFADHRIEHSAYRGEPGALVGGHIAVEGLAVVPMDVILQIRLLDGAQHSAVLRAAEPAFLVPAQATPAAVAKAYWRIGTVHILEGYDHLLFVLALLLIIPSLRLLLATITAFTLAHSVSLALATLDVVRVPGPPTEAVIALSILFLAVEIMHEREGRSTLSGQRPWLVAMAFGLVHGLGFAGALAEVGLPLGQVPLALLMFNLGVETGQLLFVATAQGLLGIVSRTKLRRPAAVWRVAPYAIGSIAAYWTIERVTSFIASGGPG